MSLMRVCLGGIPEFFKENSRDVDCCTVSPIIPGKKFNPVSDYLLIGSS